MYIIFICMAAKLPSEVFHVRDGVDAYSSVTSNIRDTLWMRVEYQITRSSSIWRADIYTCERSWLDCLTLLKLDVVEVCVLGVLLGAHVFMIPKPSGHAT